MYIIIDVNIYLVNLIGDSKRDKIMSLMGYNFMWMTCYSRSYLKEFDMTNMVPKVTCHIDIYYKIRSFYLVTNLSIFLKK